jgi:hypothetical protein
MKTYFYISGDTKALGSLPGCCYVENAGRGNGAELWFDDAAMPEGYPARVALVTPLLGTTLLQVVPLVADEGRLLKLVQEGAAKAGLVVYESAKALDAAQPAVTSACCYEQRAKLDERGEPTGETEKKTGAVLQVAHCLAGDDPVKHADPAKAEAALLGGVRDG